MIRHELGCCGFLVLVLAAGCAVPAEEYAKPEGKLQDRGSRLLVKRYYMILTTVEFAHSQEKRVRVEGLPPDREFILGLQVEAGDCSIQRSSLRVALTMTNEQGKVVIREERSLADFIWSTDRDSCVPAFAYVGGQAREVRMGDKGDVCMQPIVTGADQGRGTYFVTRESAVYSITVNVYEQAINKPTVGSATVVLEDNGARNPASARCP